MKNSVLEWVINEAPRGRVVTRTTWQQIHGQTAAPWPDPIDRAIVNGFLASTPGWTLASAYWESLRSLFGQHLDPMSTYALGVTEPRGNRPSAMETRYEHDRLHGIKTFMTLGTDVDRFLILAVRQPGAPTSGDRKDLVIVGVDARAPGIEIEELPPTRFAPEVPHARVTLVGVEVAPGDCLVEDAWERAIKPFRTVEDIFVFAATISWLLRVTRATHQVDVSCRLLACLAALRQLALKNPGDPSTHFAFGGAHDIAEHTMSLIEWSRVDVDTRHVWERDRELLEVAARARQLRLELARKRLFAT